MTKYDFACFITHNSRLEQHSVTILKFASFVYFVHKNNNKYSHENFPNEKIESSELYYA